MRRLHLCIPDMLLPPDSMRKVVAGLNLPYLNKMLARSDREEATGRVLEDVLCEAFGVHSFAAVRAAADGLDVGHAFWMCADPIHIELQQSQAILQPEIKCGAEEASTLCGSLNRHFAQDGIAFFAPHPQRWYVRVDGNSDVATTPLRIASWCDVKSFQPRGADALRWRSLSNEIQMLLHGHAINQEREARGIPAINSVWFWGGGTAGVVATEVGAMAGDASLVAPFAQVAAIPRCTTLDEMLSIERESGIWIEGALSTARQRGDLYAWREAMERVEHELARPLWKAVRLGRLQVLTLDVLTETGVHRFVFDRRSSWRVWRRADSLAAHVV